MQQVSFNRISKVRKNKLHEPEILKLFAINLHEHSRIDIAEESLPDGIRCR